MSPTATIATVVVALIFFAWLFQQPTSDPGYEAWLKRQQDEKKADSAQRAALGIAVTDAGVTKDTSSVADRAKNKNTSSGGSSDSDETRLVSPGNETPNPSAATETEDRNSRDWRPAFGAATKLDGTYIGVAFAGDVPRKADGDEPTITLRRDGTFWTQNMSQAEVDMEAATAAATGKLDRGSGRYRLFANTLELNYNDGLTRKKGNRRVYTVVPVSGPDNAPTSITIQGKLFKLESAR